MPATPTIAVVIPCFRVHKHILGVIERIGPEISGIYVIDDCCPDQSGAFVKNNCSDPRITVIRNPENQGVGGAVITGYRAAIADGFDIIVKIDGDGQMDAQLIPDFVAPIALGEADYTKGNRFFDLEKIHTMPKMRLLGNAILSFMTKLSSGYWDVFDPTNGYTAIHRHAAEHLPLEKVSRRYFFETDMLFRLNTIRAVVIDIPMDAQYGEEISHLKIRDILCEFLFKNIQNFWKRIFYNYYLRDMSLASIELPVGLTLMALGSLFGAYHWSLSVKLGLSSTPGTVMLSALPIILGLQLVLAFIGHDVRSVPSKPFHRLRRNFKATKKNSEN